MGISGHLRNNATPTEVSSGAPRRIARKIKIQSTERLQRPCLRLGMSNRQKAVTFSGIAASDSLVRPYLCGMIGTIREYAYV